MTLHQLRIFVTVAETTNVSRASARLHISQPAVTRQLKTLEEEYGTRLYQTHGRGIVLTQKGHTFLRHSMAILREVDGLNGAFSPNVTNCVAPITVGACYAASANLVPNVLRHFVATHSQIQVDVSTNASLALQRSVLSSQLDLAVVLGPEEHPALAYETISEVTPVLVAPPHRDSSPSDVEITELDEVPLFVMKNRPVSERFLQLLRQKGITPKIVRECSTPEAIRTAVKSGLGFGILFQDLVESDLQAGFLSIVNIPGMRDLVVRYVLIYRKDTSVRPPFSELLEQFRSWNA